MTGYIGYTADIPWVLFRSGNAPTKIQEIRYGIGPRPKVHDSGTETRQNVFVQKRFRFVHGTPTRIRVYFIDRPAIKMTLVTITAAVSAGPSVSPSSAD